MFETITTALLFAAALGSGLIAGAFFAFSSFVMIALARLPVPHGIAAMQSINIVVISPLFLGVFMGTAIFGAILAVMALADLSAPTAPYLLAGGLFYAVGCLGVTMVFNVPLNNQLAAVAPEEPTSVQVWTKYLAGWVPWNHLRTIGALLACAAFILALRHGGGTP